MWAAWRNWARRSKSPKELRAEEAEKRKAEQEQWRQKRAEAEYQRRLADHQRKYRCHICRKASTGPTPIDVQQVGFSGESKYHKLDWNKPANLSRCRICMNWVCNHQLENDICEQCERRLYIQNP
jgi:hypothetical protein